MGRAHFFFFFQLIVLKAQRRGQMVITAAKSHFTDESVDQHVLACSSYCYYNSIHFWACKVRLVHRHATYPHIGSIEIQATLACSSANTLVQYTCTATQTPMD